MYNIQILNPRADAQKLATTLQARVAKDSRFVIHHLQVGSLHSFRKNYPQVGKTMLPTIFLSSVRLSQKKPYCGNHPGPCEVNPFLGPQPKKNATWLEWDDWVAFHTLVNNLLNQRHMSANIWTTPQDAKGKFWIRRGRQARLHYDYSEENYGGRIIRVWNTGTEDQFES
jgi:hypothetical protein